MIHIVSRPLRDFFDPLHSLTGGTSSRRGRPDRKEKPGIGQGEGRYEESTGVRQACGAGDEENRCAEGEGELAARFWGNGAKKKKNHEKGVLRPLE